MPPKNIVPRLEVWDINMVKLRIEFLNEHECLPCSTHMNLTKLEATPHVREIAGDVLREVVPEEVVSLVSGGPMEMRLCELEKAVADIRNSVSVIPQNVSSQLVAFKVEMTTLIEHAIWTITRRLDDDGRIRERGREVEGHGVTDNIGNENGDEEKFEKEDGEKCDLEKEMGEKSMDDK